jgi:hypothetical protein
MHPKWNINVKCEILAQACYTKNLLTQSQKQEFDDLKTVHDQREYLYKKLLENTTTKKIKTVAELLIDTKQCDLARELPISKDDSFWNDKPVKKEAPFIEDKSNRQKIQKAYKTWITCLKCDQFMDECLEKELLESYQIQLCKNLRTDPEKCIYLYDHVLYCATWEEIDKIKTILQTIEQGEIADILPSKCNTSPEPKADIPLCNTSPKPQPSLLPVHKNNFLSKEEQLNLKACHRNWKQTLDPDWYLTECYIEGLLTDSERQKCLAIPSKLEKSEYLFHQTIAKCTRTKFDVIKQILARDHRHEVLGCSLKLQKTMPS